MNSTIKFVVILAISFILPFAASAQETSANKTCCKGKGDKATCCQSAACQRDSEASAASTATVASDGLSTTIACGCCKQGGASATAPIILALDIDKDGIVSASEIKNATQSLLALDKNRDGRLDRAEMHANTGFSKVNASTRASNTKPKRTIKRSGMISGADQNYFAQIMLRQRDANGNNILEANEISGPTQRIMHIIDLNEDGDLSLDEIRKIPMSVRNYAGGDPGNGGEGGDNDGG